MLFLFPPISSCGPTDDDILESTQDSAQKKRRRSTITAPTPALESLASSIRLSIRAEPGQKLPDGDPVVLQRASTIKSMVVANEQRPLDMISLSHSMY